MVRPGFQFDARRSLSSVTFAIAGARPDAPIQGQQPDDDEIGKQVLPVLVNDIADRMLEQLIQFSCQRRHNDCTKRCHACNMQEREDHTPYQEHDQQPQRAGSSPAKPALNRNRQSDRSDESGDAGELQSQERANPAERRCVRLRKPTMKHLWQPRAERTQSTTGRAGALSFVQ